MKLSLTILCLMVLTGCSYVYPIGQIGPKKLYKVQAGSLSGPTQTQIVIVDTNSNEMTFLSPMGGNGILSSVTVAGSIVAGSYFIGKGLEKSHGDNTTVNAASSATSAAEASSDANSSSTANPVLNNAPVINVPDPPPAPMIRRPPYKWGHTK